MSEPIQSIAQNNYILQAPLPTATMFTTELEYDANNKISGYAGSAFAGQGGGGASYTAGDNIDITNNVISVDDVSNLSAGDGISITQDASYTTISWLNDAGIKNVVYTASLPATPDNNTLYLIPET